MALAGGPSLATGDPGRLVFGIDAWGFTCGGRSTVANVTLDLTSQKQLYYLNPLQLLSLGSYHYTKAVCVGSCPTAEYACGVDDLPCTNATKFV